MRIKHRITHIMPFVNRDVYEYDEVGKRVVRQTLTSCTCSCGATFNMPYRHAVILRHECIEFEHPEIKFAERLAKG